MSAHGCRFSFTPLPGFFSPFPHGTLRYRSPRLFSLGTWSSQFPTRFLVSGGTHVPFPVLPSFRYRALTVSGGPSQGPSRRKTDIRWGRRCSPPKGRSTPDAHRPACHSVHRVWALPRSLAATVGISFDFSAEGTEMFQFPCGPPSRVTFCKVGFPHSETDGSKGVRPLPVAFGARHRPSSAPRRQGIPRARFPSCASSLARARFSSRCRHSLAKVHGRSPPKGKRPGGPCWIRTSDLSLIRTALSPPELKAPSGA